MNAVMVCRKSLPSLYAVITSDDPNGREHGGATRMIRESERVPHGASERSSDTTQRTRGRRARQTIHLDLTLAIDCHSRYNSCSSSIVTLRPVQEESYSHLFQDGL
jgi:hypothetical protein